jgi:hypothetical protein
MPVVMYIVTIASKKWGNTFGGILASLPWVAGPILVFMSIEQGKSFVVSSLPGVLVGIMGWMFFCSTFIVVGRKYSSFYCLIAGYLAYILFGVLIKNLLPFFGIQVWYFITFCAILLILKFFPTTDFEPKREVKKLKYDMLLRILMITSFVILITHFAKLLGPEWSGIMAPFPIMTAVLGVFIHYTQGNYQTRALFYGLLNGAFGFITFLLILHYTLPVNSIFISFLIAVSVNILISLSLHQILLRRKVE